VLSFSLRSTSSPSVASSNFGSIFWGWVTVERERRERLLDANPYLDREQFIARAPWLLKPASVGVLWQRP
ncbi:MAG: hypothetical protein O2782_07425, partial [bacterium]|nr:hypothetical protein [bacterium]